MHYKRAHQIRREQGEIFLFCQEGRLKNKYREYYNNNNVKALADFETISLSLLKMKSEKREKAERLVKSIKTELEGISSRESADSSRHENIKTIERGLEALLLCDLNLVEIHRKKHELAELANDLGEGSEVRSIDLITFQKLGNTLEHLAYVEMNISALEATRDKVLKEGFPEFITAPNYQDENEDDIKKPSEEEKKNKIKQTSEKIAQHGLAKYSKVAIVTYLQGFLKDPKLSRAKLIKKLLEKAYEDRNSQSKTGQANVIIEELENAEKTNVTRGWELNLIEVLGIEWPDYAEKLERSN